MNLINFTQNTEAQIGQAIESNMLGHMSYFANHLPGMEVLDRPDMLIINSRLPSDTFNYVCRLNFTESELDLSINFALNYFQQQQLPASWWIGANSNSTNLTEHLAKHGLKQVEEAAGMAMDLNQLPANSSLPAGLEIKPVTNINEIEYYANIIATCWNPPDPNAIKFYQQAAAIALRPESPFRFYVGYLENQPVATGELCLSGGVAGIYGLVTLEKYRKMGIGSAMTFTVLSHAKNLGYQTAILQASEDGKSIYSRLGFRQFTNFLIYQ